MKAISRLLLVFTLLVSFVAAADTTLNSDDIPVASVVTSADITTTAKTTKQSSLNSDDIPDASQVESGATTKKTGKTTNTGKTTKKSSTSGRTSSTVKSTSSTSISIDPRLPAGGIALATPTTTSTTYIKIGEFATFSWSYTSLSVTPAALNIEAYCSFNENYYTLATNHSAKNQEFVWDTESYEANATVPLLSSEYTLIMYDAASNITAPAQAGYLAVYNQLAFGMYSPQPYTPLADFKCVNCSQASSLIDTAALKWVLAMALIVVLSAVQTLWS